MVACQCKQAMAVQGQGRWASWEAVWVCQVEHQMQVLVVAPVSLLVALQGAAATCVSWEGGVSQCPAVSAMEELVAG